MSRLPKLPRDQVSAELEPLFTRLEDLGAFVPNAWHILAHVPDIAKPFVELCYQVMRVQRSLPPVLKWLVAHVSSRAAGCNYCMLHAVSNANSLRDLDEAGRKKVDAVWEFEQSPLFTEAERAALRVAIGAAVTPNAVTDQEFEDLKRHYTTEEIVEMLSVVGMFGFLNRWNDTVQPELESKPLAYAAAHGLADRGWSIGAHGPD